MVLDNFRTIELIWDKANKSIIKTIKTASSDTTGRYFSVKILDGGQEVTLNDAKLQLYWEHPNFNTSGTDDFNTINTGGLFKMTFSEEMLTNIGELTGYLVLTLPDGKITSDGFIIEVIKGADDGVVVPTNGSGLVKQIDGKIDKGNVTLNDLTQEVKLAMTGGSVAVVGENAVGTENIKDSAVTLSKIDINGYLPESFTFSRGINPNDVGITRAHTTLPILKNGTVIRVLDANYEITLFQKSGDSWTNIIRWSNEIDIDNDILDVAIAVRKVPDETLTTLFSYISTIIEVVTGETAIKRDEASILVDEKISKLDIDQTKIEDLGRPNENIIFNGLGTETLDSMTKYSGEFVKENNLRYLNVVDEKIVIDVGGWWFIRFDPKRFATEDKLNLMINIESGFKAGSNTVRFADSSGANTYINIDEPKTKMTIDIPTGIENYTFFEIRFDNRNGTEELVIDYVLANTYDYISVQNLAMGMNGSTTSSDGYNVKYVSLNGSNENTGNSIQSGYKTLQKALQELGGTGTVICERGVYYHQSVNHTAKDIKILPYDDTYDETKTNRQLVEFRGSDIISNWQSSNGIYRTAYTGNSDFNDVFVAKTTPIETSGTRPSYNVVLWEGNDGENDYKMKPVLTLAECQNEVGTFYYDGTYVYVNPNNINNEFNAVKTKSGINISGDSVEMQDIKIDFYKEMPMQLFNIKNLVAQNCEASHSSTSNGFNLDYTNGTLTNCKAVKNRNDGFNMHYYGDTTLINCKALNNYDDGVSHHEQCTGTIIGGEYSGNVKGGIIPVNGSTIQVYGAVMENNNFGFYSQSGDAISQGNFFKGNVTGLRNSADKYMRSINDVFVENETEIMGNINKY